MNKRSFSKLIIGAGGLVVSAVVGVPALLSAITPSMRRDGKKWQAVGNLDDFEIGEMTKAVVRIPRDDWAVSLREKGVFVLRETADEVIVFSRSCTDLSCPVTWDPGSGWFFCPCHGGIFAADGTPKAGPPKEPLYRYAARVREMVLEIDLNSVPPMI